jgi:uncharacterized protein YabN with tetrapyrrole methylase and pyrophosphatase domain
VLVAKGSSLSLVTPTGDSALHLLLWHASCGDYGGAMTIEEEVVSIARAMIEAGADLFALNDQGNFGFDM